MSRRAQDSRLTTLYFPLSISALALSLLLAACGGGGGSNPGNPPPHVSGPPVAITTTSLATGVAGAPYSQALAATGGNGTYTWSFTGFLDGLSLDSHTGLISGAPANQGFGQVTISVFDATDGTNTTSKTFQFAVDPVITFSPVSLPNAHLNALYDQFIQAFGFNLAGLQLTSGALPPGIQLLPTSNPSQVELTGTPTAQGSFTFTLQAVDGGVPAQKVSQTFTLVADNALFITTTRLDDGVVFNNYRFTMNAVNGVLPYHWSLQNNAPGLVIDPLTGVLSGNLAFILPPQIQFSVTDSSPVPMQSTVSLPLLTFYPLSTFPIQGNPIIKKPFSYQFNTFGGALPYTYSLVSGSLPAGLSLGQFAISGTPTQTGASNFTIQIQDSAHPPQVIQVPGSFTVVPPPLGVAPFPAILPLGIPVDLTPVVFGGTPPYHPFTFKSGSLPPGLNIDLNTGRITGAPTQLGNFPFTLTITDSSQPQLSVDIVASPQVSPPLGRNDTLAHATPISNGNFQASISPYADPDNSPTPQPDQDYYRVDSVGNTIVTMAVTPSSFLNVSPIDPVLEILDSNGVRLNTCRPSGQQQAPLQQNCLSYHLQFGGPNLDVQVPGAAPNISTIYAHVLDWRGTARPDFAYQLSISGIVGPLQIPPSPFGPFDVGQIISLPIPFKGGTPPIAFTVTSGSLPPGVTLLSGFNQLLGPPTATGSYSFRLQATDSGVPPQVAVQDLTISVNPALQITSSPNLPHAKAGVPYSFTLSVSGGTPPYVWSVLQFTWPLGILFDPVTGTLSGTPLTPGTYNGTLILGDSTNPTNFISQTVTLIVDP